MKQETMRDEVKKVLGQLLLKACVFCKDDSKDVQLVDTALSAILSLHNREVKELVGIDSIKKALYNWEERWLLCWDGEPDGMAFDCACCIDQSSNKECQCICHKREKEIAQALSKYGRKEIKNG